MQADTERRELLTVRELAREWKQHESTIYRKVERGLIPSVRLGDQTSALRIPRAELERSMHVAPGSQSSPRGSSSPLVDTGDAAGVASPASQGEAA
jgi:excisionase family DNA binding protein